MTKQMHSSRHQSTKSRNSKNIDINISNNKSDGNNSPTNSEYAEDSFHNNDTPFCRILAEIAQEIIPTITTTTNDKDVLSNNKLSSTCCDGLSSLIRIHLLNERNQQHNSVISNPTNNDDAMSSSKKKKNNKKKKKKVQLENVEEDTSSTFNELTVTECNDSKITEDELDQCTEFNHSSVNKKDYDDVYSAKVAYEMQMDSLQRFINESSCTPDSGRISNKNALHTFLTSVLYDLENTKQQCQNKNKSSHENKRNQVKKTISSTTSSSQKAASFTNSYDCHVHFSSVQMAVTDIACPTCRGAVRKAYSSDFCMKVREPFIPKTSSSNVRDDDNAFDYVSMEEGIIPVNKNCVNKDNEHEDELVFQLVNLHNNSYEDADKLGKTSGWQLCRRSLVPGSTKSSWTIDDIDFIIKNYIILSGYDPDTINNSTNISDDIIQSMTDSVNTYITTNINKKFRDIAIELEQQIEKFVFQCNSDESNIDMNSFALILDTDTVCFHAIQNLTTLLLDVTHSVKRIISFYTFALKKDESVTLNNERSEVLKACEWAIEPCVASWNIFWNGIIECSDNIECYEKKLMKSCDRLGNVPKMYLSKETRNEYRILVDSKIRTVHKMLHSIEKIINQQTNINDTINKKTGCNTMCWSTAYIRKLFTVESYCSITYNMNNNATDEEHQITNAECRSLDLPLDIKFMDVMNFVCTKWSKTLHCGYLKDIVTTHQEEKEKFSVLLHRIKNEYDDEFVNKSNPTLFCLYQNIVLFLQNSDDQIEKDRSFFPQSMAQLTSDWIFNSMSQSTIYTSKITNVNDPVPLNKKPCHIAMPLTLMQSMIVDRQITISSYNGCCDGSNGELRAVGILVGLFLKNWLSEKYKEWHARVAEEELLSALVCELQSNNDSNYSSQLSNDGINIKAINNKSKKIKKKKQKKIESENHTECAITDKIEESEKLPKNDDIDNACSYEEPNSVFEKMSSILDLTEGSKNELSFKSSHTQQNEIILTESENNTKDLSDHIESITSHTCSWQIIEESEACRAIPKDDVEGTANKTKKWSLEQTFSIPTIEEQANVLVYSESGVESAECFLLNRFNNNLLSF